MRELRGRIGIVTIHFVRNNYGGDDIPTKFPCDVYIVVEKGTPLKEVAEITSDKTALWKKRAFILHHLLCGHEWIHRQGWMHRDVTRNNIRCFGSPVGSAKLCDFGKVLFEDRCYMAGGIARKDFTPREVINGNYTQRVDIFMLAFALLQQWYSWARTVIANERDQVDEMGERLKSREEDNVIEPIQLRMTHSYTTVRPSATEALNSKHWVNAIDEDMLVELKAQRVKNDPNDNMDD